MGQQLSAFSKFLWNWSVVPLLKGSYRGLRAAPKEAVLLAPSMGGKLDEVKQLVGIFTAENPPDHQPGPCDDVPLAVYVDCADPSGNAAIHGAVFGGHLEVLVFLVESCGASLVPRNGLGCTPLWVAAGYNRVNCLEYLISALSKNSSSSSEKCSSTLAFALLEENNSGDTPFLAAASKGNLAACKCLINAIQRCEKSIDGSSNDSSFRLRLIRVANRGGDTPLGVAVAAGHDKELVALLLKFEADSANELEAKTSEGKPGSSASSNNHMQSPCLNRKNGKGLTPLLVACERNFDTLVEMLLNSGADISIFDESGKSPLAVATFCGCEDVVKLLISRPDGKALLDAQDAMGCTPLWLAARTGNIKMVKLLLDSSASSSIKNNDGLTPCEAAVKFKKQTVIDFFLPNSNNPSASKDDDINK